MKSFGIVGGLGPMATAYLLELIVDMTDARTDQEHVDAIVFNRPSVPDRTAYILDPTKPSPVPPMADMAQKLEALGVCAIGTPCVTAHSFHQALQSSVHVPFINMVQETAAYLKTPAAKKRGLWQRPAPYIPACSRRRSPPLAYPMRCRTARCRRM